MASPITPNTPAPPTPPPARTGRDAALFAAAQKLESSFLAEMLKFGGAERPPGSFGGGIGEEQFASFLTEAEATAMVKHGGIGLAEKLYAELKDRADGNR